MVSSNDSIIVGLKNSIVSKINTLIGNHNSSNTAHSDIRNSIPSKTSDLTNDSGYLTSHQDISGKANISDLGNLAYEDDVDLTTHDVSELTDTQNTTFTPKTHTHSVSDVTNLQTTLNGKANSTHSHSISEVTNLQSSLNNKVEESDLLNLIYPIGSIYMEKSTNAHSICPIQITLGGTWTRIENRFLLASEGGQGTGATGGEAAHILTEDEMPSHTHIQNSHNHTQNAHHHGTGHATYNQFLATNVNVALAQTKRVLTSEGSNYYYAYSTEKGNIQEVDNTANTTATNQAQTATNQNTGGGQAHNNMPPYIIVNVWERTA